jgi:glycosyltransferase involved in cell wall biosynthesis
VKKNRIQVIHFGRKRKIGSIEGLFNVIRKYFSENIYLKICEYESKGILKRIKNMLDAREKQGDVNHIIGDSNYLALFLEKNKTILTVHDCGSVVNSKGVRKIIIFLFWFYFPLKKVKYITVISEKTKKELLKLVNFPKKNIFVIPNCVNKNFKFSKKKFNKVKPTILHVGTKTNKNLIRVAKALRGINCELKIIGRLNKSQIKALKENQIHYENFIDLSEQEIIEQYNKADIVIFASLYEGFGLPILEAQATGRALITSNISPMKEIAGKGACLVNPFDMFSIRNGFLKVINDDLFRENIIAKGLENVKKYFPEMISKEYEKLYFKIFDEYKRG